VKYGEVAILLILPFSKLIISAQRSVDRLTKEGGDDADFPHLVPKFRVANWRLSLGTAILGAGISVRAISAFAPEHIHYFPTPSPLFLDGGILIWEFTSGPPDWALVTSSVGAMLILVSAAVVVVDFFLRWRSKQNFALYVRSLARNAVSVSSR
jgi:hypothetical protein